MFLSMFNYEAYKIEYCNIYKYDLDPHQLDFENYKELLITASSNEDHLQFHDIDSYECLGECSLKNENIYIRLVGVTFMIIFKLNNL